MKMNSSKSNQKLPERLFWINKIVIFDRKMAIDVDLSENGLLKGMKITIFVNFRCLNIGQSLKMVILEPKIFLKCGWMFYDSDSI